LPGIGSARSAPTKNNDDIPATDTTEIKQLISRVKQGELDQLRVILIEFPLFDAFDESLDLGRVGGWNVIVVFHRRSIAPILCQTSAFTKPEANFFSFFTTLS
jgi:hypothetical protein